MNIATTGSYFTIYVRYSIIRNWFEYVAYFLSSPSVNFSKFLRHRLTDSIVFLIGSLASLQTE